MVILFLMLVCMTLLCGPARAEVVLDGSMGRSGPVSGPDFLVSADMGTQTGANLFHSFTRFNIGNTESATFTGPDSVRNVISRVTGGSLSNINGLLRSTIPWADFYFINPAGVFFGQGAALDMQGSFYISTADYLRLGTDGRFNATDPGESLLSTAPPSAFGFLSQNPASIYVNNARLDAAAGRDLSIIGGDLVLDNAVLFAPEGRINILNAASSGEILPGQPDWNAGSFPRLGSSFVYGGYIITGGGEESGIYIRGDGFYARDAVIEAGTGPGPQGGMIDIRLTDLLILEGGLLRTITEGAGRGGELRLRARGLLLAGGVSAGTTTLGSGDSGDVNISVAERFEISGADQDGFRSALFSLGGSASTGTSGKISVSAPLLDLADGGLIITSSGSGGQRGDIHISADHLTLVTDSRIQGRNMLFDVGALEISSGAFIWSPAQGPDVGRTITVNARESILITGEGQNEAPWRNKTEPLYTGIHSDVFSNVDGNAGDINISSPLLRITDSGQIGARTHTDGHGGNITIDAGKVELLSGGQVAADSFGSSIFEGPAGNVTINASESVLMSGSNEEVFSGISSSTRSDADAGRIFVKTPLLRMEDQSSILVSTGVFGEGRAGDITLNVGELSIVSGAAISSASSGHGQGGSIDITASGSVVLDNGVITSVGIRSGGAGNISIITPLLILKDESGITTLAAIHLATGELPESDAGDISINVNNLVLSEGSTISSESQGYGKAGSISISARDRLESADSSITTASFFSTGGNISISSGDIILTEGSHITATVGGGSGNGGNVSIKTDALAVIEQSDITAKADQGFGGNINIQARAVIFSNDSEANASSNISGKEGTVRVNAPDIDFSGFLGILPSNYLNADLLLPKSCSARTGEPSSFVIVGRDALPLSPEGFLPAQ
ncbi:MAG: two-partner secretion domain-containing protein [Thermodesulfovibrionales bacterium]